MKILKALLNIFKDWGLGWTLPPRVIRNPYKEKEND